MQQPQKVLEILEDLALFSDLTEEELLLLEPLCFVIQGKAGDVIIREGKIIRHLFILLEGKAVIKKNVANWRYVTLAAVGKNDLVGEVTFMKRPPASVTVEAASSFRALALDQKGCHRLLRSNPLLGCKIYRKFARVLGQRLIKMTDLAAKCSLSRKSSWVSRS